MAAAKAAKVVVKVVVEEDSAVEEESVVEEDLGVEEDLVMVE